MDRLIQLLQGIHAEASDAAWWAVGALLLASIAFCFLALSWIVRGRLAPRSGPEFFAEQRQITQLLKDVSANR